MEIRRAHREDLERIMSLYDRARRFMRQSGNLRQWVGGYPDRELVDADIRAGHCYLVLEGEALLGVFCFFHGRDVEPTYARIDGAWLNDEPYGVIHRIASGGKVSGLTQLCSDWCLERCPELRIDTHADNRPMQQALERAGFQFCGVITIADGTLRMAYQKRRD